MIPPTRSTRTDRSIQFRRAVYCSRMKRAGEYAMEDIRRCIQNQSTEETALERAKIGKQARLRELTDNPLRTLRHYNEEMMFCLAHGNPEAHYVEGVKQYFALREPEKGLQHLYFSASHMYPRGIYLLAVISLLGGNQIEGERLLDLLDWKNNLCGVDKVWSQVKRSLLDVPIINDKTFNRKLAVVLPPNSCKLDDMDSRCTVCFYYKQAHKFLQFIA